MQMIHNAPLHSSIPRQLLLPGQYSRMPIHLFHHALNAQHFRVELHVLAVLCEKRLEIVPRGGRAATY
jgi:hypothetical protein